MRYAVTLRGRRSAENPLGKVETVIVDADSGDKAAEMAFQPYMVVNCVEPAPLPPVLELTELAKRRIA